MNTRKKSGLGSNPLAPAPTAKGIFQKTTEVPDSGSRNPESGSQKTMSEARKQKPESRNQKPESVSQNPESRSLNPSLGFLQETGDLDKVTLRLPIQLNDWLDDLLKQGKRKHGQKIPKEIWVQAAIELFRALPTDWSEIDSVEHMRDTLVDLESIFQKMDSRIRNP